MAVYACPPSPLNIRLQSGARLVHTRTHTLTGGQRRGISGGQGYDIAQSVADGVAVSLGRNTWLYMRGLVPFAVLAPFAIAIYTQDLPARWRDLYRGLIFVPMIIAPVVAASVWRWLLDPGHGVINLGLKAIGLWPVAFLSDPRGAIWSIIGITGWKLIGFATLIASAANAAINPSLIEAARMAGASSWPLLLLRMPDNSVIQIGIQMFMSAEGNQWGPLMAASTMACLPILAFYVALQRQVVQSFMQSGLPEDGRAADFACSGWRKFL